MEGGFGTASSQSRVVIAAGRKVPKAVVDFLSVTLDLIGS